ncbi:lipoprotein, putative [Listeria ivanovii FSL F6-596]|nr:lipoprotein, putative [Listeria ivanovii FSL F6-596]
MTSIPTKTATISAGNHFFFVFSCCIIFILCYELRYLSYIVPVYILLYIIFLQ